MLTGADQQVCGTAGCTACCKLPHHAATGATQPLTFLAMETSAKLLYPRSLAFSWRSASVFSMMGVLAVAPEDALVR